jgi:uncharacterized caspase-like protein
MHAAHAHQAFVIGNNEYQNGAHLANAVNDAKLIGAKLQKIGFELTSLHNASAKEMVAAMDKVVSSSKKGEIFFFYYAGHAVQYGGENYIIPVNAAIEEPEDLRTEGVAISSLFAKLGKAGQVNIIVLDACRNNPFEATFEKARARGLTRVSDGKADAVANYQLNGLIQPSKIPSNTMLVFSTAPGKISLDGEGENSPFADALANEILVEGQEITSVFRDVSLKVSKFTREKQEPWINWSLKQPVYLNPRKATMMAPF